MYTFCFLFLGGLFCQNTKVQKLCNQQNVKNNLGCQSALFVYPDIHYELAVKILFSRKILIFKVLYVCYLMFSHLAGYGFFVQTKRIKYNNLQYYYDCLLLFILIGHFYHSNIILQGFESLKKLPASFWRGMLLFCEGKKPPKNSSVGV